MDSKNCEWCSGTGIASYANGNDDYDVDYCSCPEGAIKMQNAEIQAMLAGLTRKFTSF